MQAKVTVVLLTYNHEKFIGQALESILAQKVNFRMEVVVADDRSTDGTPAIVQKFALKHPELFQAQRSQTNEGVKQNILNIKDRVTGQYLAILDGDDYWDYDQKLQQQVDFLDSNPEYAGIFHDARIIQVDEADKILFHNKYLYSQNYRYGEIIHPAEVIGRDIILPSSSAVLRMSNLNIEDLKLIKDNYSFLWKLTCLMIRESKFYFINQPWSVYRNHTKGISKSDNSKFKISHIHFLEQLLDDTYYRHQKFHLYQAIGKEYRILLDSTEKSGLNKQKLFRQYVRNELLKIWHYRKSLDL